jgi:serine/threonine-protein kinase
MTDLQFWRAVEELFSATVTLAPQERRDRLARFDGPSGIRREVESLLSAHDAEGAELELPQASLPAVSLSGRRVGPWAVIREVGRGGMGAVYEAIRDDAQYQKRVAIKTIGRSLDGQAIGRRFRQEQRILASLEHPNIAALIDGGVTADGLPYFVMEFVDGRPITQYCTEKRLPLKARLDLFRQVCAAVEYAHRNLVVHRDIKPSNVFVTEEGTVKLLDFGIAKLLRDTAGGGTTLTETGYRAFTTAYASPEQVRGEPISTATDIYSLGTLLYLLLSGRLPFEVEKLTPAEALARICETNPLPPSQAATEEAAAALGFRDREQLARALRGELDDIVQSALRKEPDRRYPTVSAFSDDVKRFLQGQQVMARPDTWRYRVRTFTRRNRKLVFAFGLAATFLVVGAVASAWQARVAGRERDRAQGESERASRVVGFVERLISTPTPGGLNGAAGDLLRTALSEAETDLRDDPLARAAVLRTAAKAYSAYYQFDRARSLLDTAITLDRRVAGADSREVGRDLTLLASVARGRGQFPEAIASAGEGVAILRRQPLAKPEELSEGLQELGAAFVYAGRAKEAIQVQEEAASREQARPRSLLYAMLVRDLAFSYEMLGQGARADSGYRHALALFDSLPEPAPLERGNAEFAMANRLLFKRAYVEADSAGQRALRIFTRWNGPDNVWVAHTRATLSAAALGQGQRPRALEEVDAALHILEGKSISVLERTRIELQQVRALSALGRFHESGAVAEGVLARRRASLADEPLMIGEATAALGEIRFQQRRLAEAESLFLEAYANYDKAMGQTSGLAKNVAAELVFLFTVEGKPDRAAPYAATLPPAFVTSQVAAAREYARTHR